MAKEEHPTGQEEHVYSQLEDRVMKTAALFFGQDLLPYAGFHKKIVGIAPTEAVLYALAIKLLDQDELRTVKEMMRMTLLGQMLREDGIEEGLEKGMEKGLEKGEFLKLITLVMKKMRKGQPPEVIAEDLVEHLSVIQPICEYISKNPGCDADTVYEMLICK